MSKPFVYGTAVFGENFTDRKAETKRLRMNFEAGVNTILISPRRTGKTSLVYRSVEQIEDPSVKVVMIDIYDCRDEYEFYERFASAILKGLATKGVGPKTEKPEDILDLPEQIARKRNWNIVICIDEFQQIGEFPESMAFQKKVRGIWQLQKRVTYCVFGSKKHMMDRLFQDKSMPFYHFGDMIELSPIPKEDWVDYIIRRFNTRNMKISAELAGEICDKVQRYSSYVQQLSWNVMVEAEGADVVTGQHVEDGFEMLVRQTSSLFMGQIANLTSFQMNYLKAVVAGVHSGFSSSKVLESYRLGSKSNIARIENVLIEKELLEKRADGVYIADPVFAYWFQREYCK